MQRTKIWRMQSSLHLEFVGKNFVMMKVKLLIKLLIIRSKIAKILIKKLILIFDEKVESGARYM
jgi:hypothetical protein